QGGPGVGGEQQRCEVRVRPGTPSECADLLLRVGGGHHRARRGLTRNGSARTRGGGVLVTVTAGGVLLTITASRALVIVTVATAVLHRGWGDSVDADDITGSHGERGGSDRNVYHVQLRRHLRHLQSAS